MRGNEQRSDKQVPARGLTLAHRPRPSKRRILVTLRTPWSHSHGGPRARCVRMESSLRGAQRRSNPENVRALRSPGLLRFARNDDRGSTQMQLALDRYLEEIVKPTVQDFVEHPTSVRHAFLACAVTFHAVDYMAHPRAPRTLRQQWRSRSEAFRRVDEVAHAFKHVATHRQNQARLVAKAIYIETSPSLA
jgi:hypothetical protein